MSDPAPEPPASSAGRVYERVKAMAITYRLKPSERLNEVEIARLLGVSRTPLREALNRLAAEGFLVATANKGFSALPLDPDRVRMLYEYRTMLELEGLRLAAERAGEAALADLAAYAEAVAAAPEEGLARLEMDEVFHLRLMALAGNEEMLRSLRSLNERIRFMRWIDMRVAPLANRPEEHVAIVAHLRAGRTEAAVASMRAHIVRRQDRISEMIRQGFAEIYTGNALASEVLGEAG